MTIFNSIEHSNLLSQIEKKTCVINEDNLDIVVKCIPDWDIKGDLDPRVLAETERMREAFSPSIEPPSIEEMRKAMGFPNIDITKTKINVSSKNILGRSEIIPVKIYSPEDNTKLRPAIVFFHGGGFFGGSLKTVENPCKYLAEKADAVVISVDYRLAPENKFPAGFNDCFDAVKWVYENSEVLNIDSAKIAVSGDSAGGNLAAVCSLMDRDLGTNMIKFQALVYPVVNLSRIETEDYKWDVSKYEINQHKELIKTIVNGLNDPDNLVTKLYLENLSDETTKYVSPLFAESFENLPTTLIITAEFDFLRLQGESYARKLKNAGVKVKLIRYNGMDRAFMDKLGVYPQAADCMKAIAEDFKAAL